MPRNSTTYKIAGTKFLRLGSSAILEMFGSNMQNIEKSIRRIYIPDSKKVFLQVDQAGAEALIVAYLCRPNKFRNLFLFGVKPHVFVALHIFVDEWRKRFDREKVDEALKTEIPLLKSLPFWKELDTLIKSSDNWPANERYYYVAKMICHGLNYGMKSGAFQLNTLEKSRGKIALSKKEAERYYLEYHTLFPEIREWQMSVANQLYATNYLFNLQGFPLYFDTVNDGMMREGISAVPQSTVGCITHIAYTKMQQYIEKEKLDWDLLANTHDSYLAQCPDFPEEIKHCATKMQEFMNQELICGGEKFRMKSEIVIGHNWSPFSTEKNPQGLKEYFI